MNINQPTIWDTIEFDCIARDFDYLQYKQAHFDMNCKGAVVSKVMYNELIITYFDEFCRDHNIPTSP